MALSPAARKAASLLLLAALGAAAWGTIGPGVVRWLTVIVLAGFALRIVLVRAAPGQ